MRKSEPDPNKTNQTDFRLIKLKLSLGSAVTLMRAAQEEDELVRRVHFRASSEANRDETGEMEMMDLGLNGSPCDSFFGQQQQQQQTQSELV